MNLSDFFEKEYINYAMYDNYRSCGSYIDGLKPSARKILHTVNKFNITTSMKVSQLGAKVAENTQYLHGEQSLVGVISGLAQDYAGSNNINLLKPDGSFGSRFMNEPAAGRYIFTSKSKWFDAVFNKEDFEICHPQYFEGDEIEPKYLLPILPLLAVNGSEGIGNGYAQKILPRDPKEIANWLLNKTSNGKKKFDLIPYFKGFNGKIIRGDNPSQWYIYGKINKVNATKIIIEEIPITYDLDGYRKVLDTLEENQIIKSAKDLSENDVFKFEIQCTREFGSKSDEQIYDELKLIKTVTENYTCINGDNSIVEFNTLEEMLDAYYTERIKYYDIRKKHVIKKIEALLILYVNKLKFIKAILDGKLVLNKRKQADVEVDLVSLGITKIDESYKYLFDMSIMSVTYELLNDLSNKCKAKKEELDEYMKKTIAQLWEEDIANFLKNK